MIRALALVALLAGCSKKQEPPKEPPPPISAQEVQRGADACADYIKRICACAEQTPALKSQCDLAKPYADTIEVSRQVVMNPETQSRDAAQAAATIRNTFKRCTEESGKLAAAGCP